MTAVRTADEQLRPRRALDWGRRQKGAPGFGLYIILIVFTLLNVPSRIPALGAIRPSLLLIAVITALVFANRKERNWGEAPNTTRYLNLLFAYVVITLPLVEWPGSVLRTGLEGLLKAAVFFYFTAYLVDSLRRLQVLMFVVLGCQVIRVLEPLYLHVTTGYWGSRAYMTDGEFMARLAGAPSDIINPNGLAFVIVSTLPFLHYLLGGSQRRLLKLLYVALLIPLLYAFSLTGSRSGLVGLIVVVGLIIWRSRRQVALGVATAAAGVLMLATMSTDLQERYLSLAESGTRHSETRQGRIETWKQEFGVAMKRPLFGHGLGTSPEAKSHAGRGAQIAHNLYTETFIELGIVGLFLYLRLLASILQNVRRVGVKLGALSNQASEGRQPERRTAVDYCRRAADATFAWVVMCLVFSMASYGLSEFYWYLIAGISVALVRAISQLGDSIVTGGASRSAATSARRLTAGETR